MQRASAPPLLGPLLDRFFSPTTTVYTQWVFWVSFRMNGEEIDFSVPETTYINLTEGMQGLLTSKGERFITFRPGPDGGSSRPSPPR